MGYKLVLGKGALYQTTATVNEVEFDLLRNALMIDLNRSDDLESTIWAHGVKDFTKELADNGWMYLPPNSPFKGWDEFVKDKYEPDYDS